MYIHTLVSLTIFLLTPFTGTQSIGTSNNLDSTDPLRVKILRELSEDNVYSGGLCVPTDDLKDVVEFFPDFDNDLISFRDLLLTPDHLSPLFSECIEAEKKFWGARDHIESKHEHEKDFREAREVEDDFREARQVEDDTQYRGGELEKNKHFLKTHDVEVKKGYVENSQIDSWDSSHKYSKKHIANSGDDDDIGDGEISCVFKKPRSKRARVRSPCRKLSLFRSPSKNQYQKLKLSNSVKTRRRCTHCQAENTPQWRMGPLGKNTLCNACGVRYKSGRLLPEYRPASSPTFDSSKHSNFHKRIMRKKKSSYTNTRILVN